MLRVRGSFGVTPWSGASAPGRRPLITSAYVVAYGMTALMPAVSCRRSSIRSRSSSNTVWDPIWIPMNGSLISPSLRPKAPPGRRIVALAR